MQHLRSLAALVLLVLSGAQPVQAQEWDLFRFRFSNPPRVVAPARSARQVPSNPPVVTDDPFLRSGPVVEEPPPSQRQQTKLPQELPSRASTRWQVLAESVEGRPIEMTTLGRGSEKILLVGPLAGDEVAGIGMIDKLVDFLEQSPEKLGPVELTLIRDPNPDGNARFQRENSRGVELNRNFPAADWEKIPHQSRWISGRTPSSEPETKALVQLINRLEPDRLVVLQADRQQTGVAQVGTPTDWAAWIAQHSELKELPPKSVALSGSLASFASRDRNIPTLVMIIPAEAAAQRNWNRFGPALLSSLNRQPQRSTPPPDALAPRREHFAQPTRHELPLEHADLPTQPVGPASREAMPRTQGPQGQSLPLFGPLVPLEERSVRPPQPRRPSRRQPVETKPTPLFRGLFPKAKPRQEEPPRENRVERRLEQESEKAQSSPQEDRRLPQEPIPIYRPK